MAVFLMLFKAGVVAFHIHGETLFPGQFQRHLHREAVGIVQVEGALAVDYRAGHARGNLFKLVVALLEGFVKAAFFQRKLFQHKGGVAAKLRINGLVLRDNHLRDFAGKAFRQTQLHTIAHRAADEAAQHIALPHIARAYAPVIPQYKGGGAHMVAHNAERLGHVRAVAIVFPAQFRDFPQDARKQVGIIHAFFAGEHANSALQTHAGIDVFMLQRLEGAILLFVILHKHIVPDFQIAAAGTRGRAIRAARLLIGNDKHFAVRAAGAGQPRGAPPVVFLGQEENPLVRHAAIPPKLCALLVAGAVVIAREHAKGELFLGQAQILGAGEKLPAPGDHFFFKIVAQRPVAQHLKKGKVAEIAHIVNIAGTHTLLHIGQPCARGVLRPQQVRHQRVHSRRGEKHRRIVFGNEGRAGDQGMAFILEKPEKQRTQLGGGRGFHGILSLLYPQLDIT